MKWPLPLLKCLYTCIFIYSSKVGSQSSEESIRAAKALVIIILLLLLFFGSATLEFVRGADASRRNLTDVINRGPFFLYDRMIHNSYWCLKCMALTSTWSDWDIQGWLIHQYIYIYIGIMIRDFWANFPYFIFGLRSVSKLAFSSFNHGLLPPILQYRISFFYLNDIRCLLKNLFSYQV